MTTDAHLLAECTSRLSEVLHADLSISPDTLSQASSLLRTILTEASQALADHHGCEWAPADAELLAAGRRGHRALLVQYGALPASVVTTPVTALQHGGR